MDRFVALIVCVGAGYVCGSLPWGLWLGRWFRGVDVRTMGSGNLGATNVYRSLGPRLGIVTLLLDIAKGAVPVWLVPAMPVADAFPGGPQLCAIAVGLAAISGHVWTFLASFRGGKGVATTAGVLLALAPGAFGIFAIVFLLTLAVTRYVSVGSMVGAVAFAIALAIEDGGWRSARVIFGVAAAVLVVVRHRENLGRLANGTERRFHFRPGARP